jgi:mRNA interferase MazF
MIYRGEVYWLASRGTHGREQSGRRPAVVIQNDRGNESSESTIVALMTSRVPSRPYPMHVVVASDETGLDGDSTVLLEQLQTVDVRRLRQRVGMLSPGSMEQIDRAIHRSLGIIFCPGRNR